MLRIGEFSKIAQVSIKTLRYYDTVGLLKPAWIDRFNGYRYYHLEQLASLNRILALKELGFSLEQIQKVLQDSLPAAELRRMMQLKQMELEQQIRQDTVRLSQLEARLHQISEEGTLPQQEVIVKEVPPRLVAGLRKTVSGYEIIPLLYKELCSAVPAACQEPDPALPAATLHYDREYIESGMNVELVTPVTERAKGSDKVKVSRLEGVAQMACLIHQGSLVEIPSAYQQLAGWIEANGYRIIGQNREVYLQGLTAPTIEQPGIRTETASSDRTQAGDSVVTELQIPVERKPIPIFIKKFKEYPTMETKIVTKPGFTVVGLKYVGKNKNNEIAQMWQQIGPRFAEIKHVTSPYESFGVCGNLHEDGNFEYIAGLPVGSTDDIPEGMHSWEVPEQTYAVFTCTLPDIHKAYEYAHTEWLPNNNYQRADGPDFEYYDEKFEPAEPESLMYIYIPIEKKI